jgi:hypothetical protein
MPLNLRAQILTRLAAGVTFLAVDPQIGKSAGYANAVAEQLDSTSSEEEIQ